MHVRFTFNRVNITQSMADGLKANIQFVSKLVHSPAPSGIGAKAITANGTYYSASEGLEGYNIVDVNVSGGGGSTLIEKTVSANGVYNASSDSADGYSKVTVSVPASAVDTGTKSITANGTGIDVVGYAAVDVAVPNSYAAADEGKVVSNGALVAQTSDTVTQNGTVDTTLINSLTVNVSGGGGSGLEYEEGTYTAASDANPTISFSNSHNTAPAFVMFVDSTGEAQTTSNRGIVCMFGNLEAVVSGGVPYSGGTADGVYAAFFHGSSADATTGGNRSPISNNLTASGFTPFFGATARTCQSGRTYKWLAVWR